MENIWMYTSIIFCFLWVINHARYKKSKHDLEYQKDLIQYMMNGNSSVVKSVVDSDYNWVNVGELIPLSDDYCLERNGTAAPVLRVANFKFKDVEDCDD